MFANPVVFLGPRSNRVTDADLIQVVNQVFVESFEIAPEKLTPAAHLFTDLGLDSLDMVDLVAVMQKRFGVKIRDDERIRAVRTLQDLYNYLIAIKAEHQIA
jgi:acyl carrier protein